MEKPLAVGWTFQLLETASPPAHPVTHTLLSLTWPFVHLIPIKAWVFKGMHPMRQAVATAPRDTEAPL